MFCVGAMMACFAKRWSNTNSLVPVFTGTCNHYVLEICSKNSQIIHVYNLFNLMDHLCNIIRVSVMEFELGTSLLASYF